MNEPNCAASSGEAALPFCAFKKMADAVFSEQKSASAWFMPWSDSRQPWEWKKSWRFFSAARKSEKLLMSVSLASASFATQALKASDCCTARALSGRNAGSMMVAWPEAAKAL